MDPVSLAQLNPLWIAVASIIGFFVVALFSGYLVHVKAHSIARSKNADQ